MLLSSETFFTEENPKKMSAHKYFYITYCGVDLLVEIFVGKVNRLGIFIEQNSMAYKMYVDLAANETLLPIEQCLFTKLQNLCFALNCTILD